MPDLPCRALKQSRRTWLCENRHARPVGTWRIAACLVVSILAGSMSFAPARGAAQENPHKQVVVTNRDGRVFSGNLMGLANGQLVVNAGEMQHLPTKTLIDVQIRNRQIVLAPADPLVVMASGDILAARVLSSDAESITVRWARFPTWDAVKVPLEVIRGIVFDRPAGGAADARLWNRLAHHRERHDLVVLTNGDTLVGQFESLDEQALHLETPNGKSSIDRAGIRAVAFNPELINPPRLEGEGALVSLVDGSRLRARELKLGPLDRIEFRTLFGARLELSLLSVESLRFLGGCATYLSDLEPDEYRFEPFFDFSWPLALDRSVAGGPLGLRGVVFPKGLGMHSRCEVSYRLDGRYRRFQAKIGIDDATNGKGDAEFEVVVDGKPVYRSGHLNGTSPIEVLDHISLSGAKRLTLRVDFGALGDIQDHADWCDALLVR